MEIEIESGSVYSTFGFVSRAVMKKERKKKMPYTEWVKNLSATQGTQVQSLGQEDPLEKKMATHCNILAWEIPWTEEPDWLQSMGLKESETTYRLNNNKRPSPTL